jgi:TolB-like protein
MNARTPQSFAIALACAALMAGSARAESQAKESVKLALLPVVVHSSESPDYLRSGLGDMLASRLDQADVFQLVRIEDPSLATSRLSEALETARGLGVDYVLFGSFTRFGSGASLDMQCAAVKEGSPEEPLREIFVHSGSIGDVIPDLDDLVGKVSRFAFADFGESVGVSSAPPPAAQAPSAGAKPPPDSDALSDEIAELRARVSELEAAIDRIETSPAPETAAAAP